MARKRQRNSSQGELFYDFSEQQKKQIGSMSMPQPPQNWPQNERDESHDTKNLPDSEQQKQQIGSMSMPQPPQNWPQNERDESHDTKNLPDSNESEEKSKRTRGPTMMHSGWGKDGGNLHIELNEHGQVIGLEGTRLSSKLGVLARNGILAPLNHKDWRLVPSMYKDRIWAHIKENTDASDDMKCILMMSFGSKWKESRHEAKTIGYDPYNTDIERLAHCPDRVEEDQWRSLVHYWSSKEARVCARFLFLHLLY
uniref:Leucine-rich repeat resistance protein n=1 Tax=Solanum tuberosum TaxID=4113 RepID=M1BA95_SOLTU